MKNQYTLLNLALFCATSFSIAQENNAEHPCISEAEYATLDAICAKNSKPFPNGKTALTTQLNWPLQAGGGLTDCSFYYISAHVDQDPAATTFKDHNCGTIAYDGHKGTDIAIGPFPFYKMDNNQVEVHAAAAGTIIARHDGEFDRNCVGSGSNLTANSIIIQHSDGSCALYWHMKANSLTSKQVGQTVTAGEYLGVVGSSGSSSGPHLHFEVWAGNTSATLNDPFSGTCNLMNASSWWAAQKPYTEPEVIKASVHTTDYIAPACGTTETSNESTTYTIPFQGPGMTPGYAKFYIFIRNETNGNVATMKIINPNSTVFNTWTSTSTATYKFSYKGFSKLLPTTQGTYTFEATYNGITCSQKFDIINPTGINEAANSLHVEAYPNPSSGELHIKTGKEANCELVNGLGQIVTSLQLNSANDFSARVSDLDGGIYFLVGTTDNKRFKEKIVILK